MFRRMIISIGLVALASAAIVALLFLVSEDLMQRNNPFVRRFAPYVVERENTLDLRFNSYYFAGHEGSTIYLGNFSAPLHVVAIDQAGNQKTVTIKPEKSNFKFRRLRLKIIEGNFFLTDGYVPCVYGGSTSDWRASLIDASLPYFNNAIPIDGTAFAFRSNTRANNSSVLGAFSLRDSTSTKLFPKLLQKQIKDDGIFDTDGDLHVCHDLKKIIYVYRYRNQFIVAEPDGRLDYLGKTIDTISKVDIRVAKLTKRKERTMSAPPVTVNTHSAVYRHLLFVNSPLRGKFDDKDAWKNSSTIDVYDLRDNTYIMSFYLGAHNGQKLTSFYINGHIIYALIDKHMLVYRIKGLLHDEIEKLKDSTNKKIRIRFDKTSNLISRHTGRYQENDRKPVTE